MSPSLPTPRYLIRLALELDGELIEERLVEPNEVVSIGHEQRGNLLCWGKLPRKLTLFTYERGEPIVQISPQWLTSKARHHPPRPITAHTPPEDRVIPTPLHHGDLLLLDLDGATLRIERLDPEALQLEHHQIPSFLPRTGSAHAPRIAFASMALLSSFWMLSAFAWDNASPDLRDRLTAQRMEDEALTRSTYAMNQVTPRRAPGNMSIGGGGLLGASHDTGGHGEAREDEVLRRLRQRSPHYSRCFESLLSPEQDAAEVSFELQIEPEDVSSRVAQVELLQDPDQAELVSCLEQQILATPLPHYQTAFPVRLNLFFRSGEALP